MTVWKRSRDLKDEYLEAKERSCAVETKKRGKELER